MKVSFNLYNYKKNGVDNLEFDTFQREGRPLSKFYRDEELSTSMADLIVYKVADRSQVTAVGIWFITNYRQDADKLIYLTNYMEEADLRVYFTEFRSQSGLVNQTKFISELSLATK